MTAPAIPLLGGSTSAPRTGVVRRRPMTPTDGSLQMPTTGGTTPTNGTNGTNPFGASTQPAPSPKPATAPTSGMQPTTNRPPAAQTPASPPPTFAQMQAAGQARPAPQQVQSQYQTTAQPSPTGSDMSGAVPRSSVPGTASVQGTLSNQIQQALTNPSAYGAPQVQAVFDMLNQQLGEDYGYQRKQLNDEMATRGLSESTIAGQRYSDLATEQARAEANMATQLATQAAQTYGQDRNSALQSGLSYTGLGNQSDQFQQELAQALGIAKMQDTTANRNVDLQAAQTNNDLMFRLMASMGGMTSDQVKAFFNSMGAGSPSVGGVTPGGTGGGGGGGGTTPSAPDGGNGTLPDGTPIRDIRPGSGLTMGAGTLPPTQMATMPPVTTPSNAPPVPLPSAPPPANTMPPISPTPSPSAIPASVYPDIPGYDGGFESVYASNPSGVDLSSLLGKGLTFQDLLNQGTLNQSQFNQIFRLDGTENGDLAPLYRTNLDAFSPNDPNGLQAALKRILAGG